MKNIYPLIILIILSGCAVSGKSLIHSPSANGAIPIKHHSVHGGATKNAPPDAVKLSALEEKSIGIVVQAQRLKDQNLWGGIIIPIFPMFFFPANEHYKEDPNSLILRFSLLAKDSLTFLTDSIKIKTQGKYLRPETGEYNGKLFSKRLTLNPKTDSTDISNAVSGNMYYLNFIEIKYPIDAFKVDKFQLFVEGIYKGSEKLSFPVINFRKTKQRFYYLGP